MDPNPAAADAAAIAAMGVFAVVYVVFLVGLYVLACLPLAGVFKKAGIEGWKAWVPFYNGYVLLRMVGRPGWWLALMFVPLLNLAVSIIASHDLSKSFGKDVAFTVGLVLLGPVFLFVLWLGDARYRGPAALSPAGGGVAPNWS